MPPPYRTDYLAHDAEYRRRRAAGYPGWDTEADLQRVLARLDACLADVPVFPGVTLLELGCGAGDVTLHLAAKGWRAFGIDIAPFAVAWAQEKATARGSDATFFTADVTKPLSLPIPPADLVLDGHCLHCLIGADRAAFLANAYRALRPGGLLHVDTMCGEPKTAALQACYDPRTRCCVAGDVAFRYLGSPDAIEREVKDAGFGVVRSSVVVGEGDDEEDCLLLRAVKPMEM